MNDRARMNRHDIEEGVALALDFDKLDKVATCGQPLVPVAVQDADNGELLILAYANPEALQYSLDHRVATFWSTSRNELWIKGATSGDYLDLVEVRVNCEQNSLLYRVRRRGQGCCHTQDRHNRTRPGCFYRRLGKTADAPLEFI